MVIIKFATKLRGFFRHLMDSKYIHFEIVDDRNKIYEVPSKINQVKKCIVRSYLADLAGVIQRITFRCSNKATIAGSFNRFLNSDVPYFIYVENPTALYHYTLRRSKYPIGKRKLKLWLNDANLRALVFMSKACKKTFKQLVGEPHKNVITHQIYPLIPRNPYISNEQIITQRHKSVTKFLYIAQGMRFDSKGGYEIVEAFNRLKKSGLNISLTMVTNLEQIPANKREVINSIPDLILCDFKFSYSQMQKLYSEHDVLLQPTSDDSFGLTILEALHSGLAFITSSLYSIPEIVRDGINGYLVEPAYWFFNPDGMPNPLVWNHRKSTIHSGRLCERLVNQLEDRMRKLATDKELLTKMSLQSFKSSQEPPFSEEFISNQWNDLIAEIANSN